MVGNDEIELFGFVFLQSAHATVDHQAIIIAAGTFTFRFIGQQPSEPGSNGGIIDAAVIPGPYALPLQHFIHISHASTSFGRLPHRQGSMSLTDVGRAALLLGVRQHATTAPPGVLAEGITPNTV